MAAIAPDEMTWPLAPEAEAFRLGLYALVRLKASDAKAYDAIAAAVLDAQGRPVVRGGPSPTRCSGQPTRGRCPHSSTLLSGPGVYTSAFAARGLAGHADKDPAAVEALLGALAAQPARAAVRVQAVRGLGRSKDPRATKPLLTLLDQPSLGGGLRLEVVAALGQLRARDGLRSTRRSHQRSVARHAWLGAACARPGRFGRLHHSALGHRSRSGLDGSRGRRRGAGDDRGHRDARRASRRISTTPISG